ncbi:DoxX family protein [Leifsonia kafniensis]|uniref:DoxX family protein n=1 Tax=Leifsonia kafniensis TaxID=475957 RepID=A0ABP7L0Q3_9MICO
MTIFLWILQALLAAMFLMAGAMKTLQPIDKLAPKLPWVTEFPTATVRFIGIAELLAALGLILPAATGILPILTPVAAVGLAIIMALAIVFHLRRKEFSGAGFNIVLLAVMLVVAIGRFGAFAF